MFGKKEQRLEVPKETKSGYYVPRWFAEDVMEALAFARLEDGLSDERMAGFLLGTAFCAIPRGDHDHGKDVRGFLRDCSAKVDALLEVPPSISEADQAIRDGIKAGLEDAGFEVDCLGQVIFACKEVRDA